MFIRKKELEVPCLPVSPRRLGQGRESPYTSRENANAFSFKSRLARNGSEPDLAFNKTKRDVLIIVFLGSQKYKFLLRIFDYISGFN